MTFRGRPEMCKDGDESGIVLCQDSPPSLYDCTLVLDYAGVQLATLSGDLQICLSYNNDTDGQPGESAVWLIIVKHPANWHQINLSRQMAETGKKDYVLLSNLGTAGRHCLSYRGPPMFYCPLT